MADHVSAVAAAPAYHRETPNNRSLMSASNPETAPAPPGCASATSRRPCRNDRGQSRAPDIHDRAKDHTHSSGTQSRLPAELPSPGARYEHRRSDPEVWALPSACRDRLLRARLRTHRLPAQHAPTRFAVAHPSILRCRRRPAPIALREPGGRERPDHYPRAPKWRPASRTALPQFSVAQRQRVPNRAIDPEPIIGGVDLWRREMTAYV